MAVAVVVVASGVVPASRALPAAHASSPVYTRIDVSSLLPGAVDSEVTAVNSSGVTVGWYATADNRDHAFKYDGGVVAELPLTAGSRAFDVNDHGDIVGEADWRPFVYHDGVVTLLTLPSDACGFGSAVAINNRGDVAGNYWAGVGSCGPFRIEDHAWLLYSGATTMLTFAGPHTFAADIADDGTFAYNASSQPFNYIGGATVWKPDTLRGTPLLFPPQLVTGDPTASRWSVAHRFNSHNDLAMTVHSRTGQQDYFWAYRWTNLVDTRFGTWQGVPSPVPPGTAEAFGINAAGDVVGQLNNRPFVTNLTTTLLLHDPSGSGEYGSSTAINDAGLVGGWVANFQGVMMTGHHHAILWVPAAS